MITAEHITFYRKSFNRRHSFSLSGINFSLEDGYIMTLLGENGAGKTTLLSLLYGLAEPTEGNVLWEGKNIFTNLLQYRREAAFVGENNGMFPKLAMEENIRILSHLYPDFSYETWNTYRMNFDIPKAACPIEELSTGQQKKLALAFALARHPKLLLLDEPTANLDPIFRVDFMQMLQEHVAEEGISVIISTHILSDVNEITDYVMLLKQGKMLLFKDRESIMEQYETYELSNLIRKGN